MRRTLLIFFTAALLALSPAGALANSGSDEYTENPPSAGGGGGGGVGNVPSIPDPTAPSASAPATGTATTTSEQPSGGFGNLRGLGHKGEGDGKSKEADKGGSVGGLVDDVAGGSSDGLGVLLPIILAATLAGGMLLLLARRRRGASEA
jgi:hypothetical protein